MKPSFPILLTTAILTLSACTGDMTNPLGGMTSLIPSSDPAVRACRAKERQAAFDAGLNPMQALERMRSRCG